jgi:RNA polymerase sigma factor (sigma-70 family)
MQELARLSIPDLARHDLALRSRARSLVANGHDVDEVVQETWLALIQHHAPVQDLQAWLGCVIRRQAGRLRRRAACRARHESHANVRPSMAAVWSEEVESLLGRLPEPSRQVVRMRYCDELSIDEIARELGRSRNTVKAQIRRATADLRRRVAPGAV